MADDVLNKKAKELIDNWGKNLKQGDNLDEKVRLLLKKMAFGHINEDVAKSFAADIASYCLSSPQVSVDEIKKIIENAYWFFDDMELSKITEEEYNALRKSVDGDKK